MGVAGYYYVVVDFGVDPKRRKDLLPSARTRRVVSRFAFLNSPLLLVAAGVLGVSLLIVYLISQASQTTDMASGDHGAGDDDPSLPGLFVASQGGRHLTYSFTRSHDPIPYCEGVVWSGAPEASTTPSTGPGTATPAASPTAEAEHESTPHAEPTPRDDCYASNPPTSGPMLNAQRGAEVGEGILMNFPPEPDVYPRDVDIPREAIVHSLEHAGVFVAYNCTADDQACWDAVGDMEKLVNKRIDNNDDRVTMGYFSDLLPGEIALAAWTRVDRFPSTEFDLERVETFISTYSCRYDEEGFC